MSGCCLLSSMDLLCGTSMPSHCCSPLRLSAVADDEVKKTRFGIVFATCLRNDVAMTMLTAKRNLLLVHDHFDDPGRKRRLSERDLRNNETKYSSLLTLELMCSSCEMKTTVLLAQARLGDPMDSVSMKICPTQNSSGDLLTNRIVQLDDFWKMVLA